MSILTLYVTLHSIGVTMWVGMALLLPIVILPVVRTLDEPGRTRFMAALARRYLIPFIVAGLVVGATGWAQTFLLFDAFGHNPIIYIKHITVVLLILASAYISFILGPRFAKAQSAAAGLWRQLEILAWIQLVLGAAVLFLCAWMLT